MNIPLTGTIKNQSLVKILVFLNKGRKTGTLSLKTPLYTKKIFINAGDVIFASSTNEDDRLGEMLLKANKITVEQYDKSVEILRATRKRQGAILVEQGFITPKDLFWGVKYQVKEIIHSMFLLEDAEYEFLEGDIPTQEVITLKMSMGNLIYEGVKKIENWTRIRKELPDTSSILKLSNDPLNLFQDIELTSQDKKILSMINGKKTIKELLENSWMGSFEALKILYVLWSIGIAEHSTAISAEGAREESVSLSDILEPVSAEEETFLQTVKSLHAQLGTLSPAKLLEVDEKADFETITRNYYRLTKEFHPDRYFAAADDSIKGKLTAIFDAVTRAYNELTAEKKKISKQTAGTVAVKEPQKTEMKDDSAKAEENFKKGVEAFKKADFVGAIDNFRRAAKIMPKNASYWNYLSLACSKIQGRIAESVEALETAIKIEPANADYHANLGLIYLKAGRKDRAENAFEAALKIDPQNVKAKKGLSQARKG